MSEPTPERQEETAPETTRASSSLRDALLLVAGFLFLGLAALLLLFGDQMLARLQPATQPSGALEGVEPLPVDPDATTLQPSGRAGAPQVGDDAPAFMLEDMQGRQVRLDDHAGQHVILNFWATWCGPCIFEMPELQATYEQRRDAGVVILGLNYDEDPETVERFLQRELDVAITFPILFDEHAETAGRYAVYNLPTTYFVNPEGVITAIHRGPLTQEQIEAYLAQGDI